MSTFQRRKSWEISRPSWLASEQWHLRYFSISFSVLVSWSKLRLSWVSCKTKSSTEHVDFVMSVAMRSQCRFLRTHFKSLTKFISTNPSLFYFCSVDSSLLAATHRFHIHCQRNTSKSLWDVSIMCRMLNYSFYIVHFLTPLRICTGRKASTTHQSKTDSIEWANKELKPKEFSPWHKPYTQWTNDLRHFNFLINIWY